MSGNILKERLLDLMLLCCLKRCVLPSPFSTHEHLLREKIPHSPKRRGIVLSQAFVCTQATDSGPRAIWRAIIVVVFACRQARRWAGGWAVHDWTRSTKGLSYSISNIHLLHYMAYFVPSSRLRRLKHSTCGGRCSRDTQVPSGHDDEGRKLHLIQHARERARTHTHHITGSLARPRAWASATSSSTLCVCMCSTCAFACACWFVRECVCVSQYVYVCVCVCVFV